MRDGRGHGVGGEFPIVQLQVLQRTRPRGLRLAKADRWLWALLSRRWAGWRTALVIVKPETVIA